MIRIGSSCREMSELQIKERYKMRFFDDDIIVSSPTNLKTLSFLHLKIRILKWDISLMMIPLKQI